MVDLWYALVAVLLAAYVVLAGFDLGAGALHVVIAKTDGERRAVISAIGPFWHGNEVWILAAGGTLMLAFPVALASALSGFYLGMFFAIWALMVRAASIELRNHAPSDLWHAFWDAMLSMTSATYIVLLGVVLGNLVRGVPLAANGTFSTQLFGGQGGLVDGYTGAVGVFALLAVATHGATFLAWKLGDDHLRWRRVATLAWPITLVAWGAIFLASRFVASFGPRGTAGWGFVPIAALAGFAATWLLRKGQEKAKHAFLASCAFLAANMFGIAASLHPTILRSLDGRDLRAVDAMTQESGLKVAVGWWAIAFVLACLYTANAFRKTNGSGAH